jgi:transcriptional regulator GlxA family with amidase domain
VYLSDLKIQAQKLLMDARKDIASVAVEIAFSSRISMRRAQVSLMLTEHQTYYKIIKTQHWDGNPPQCYF